jgi:hypothetical protein
VEADRFKGEWSTLRVYALLEREWHARRDSAGGCGELGE